MTIANIKAKITSIANQHKNGVDVGSSISRMINMNFSNMPTILSSDIEVDGIISSSGLIEIEGRVKGKISGNSIVIREGGIVEGDIFSESITIKGGFVGNIKSKNINISSKAVVQGAIEYDSLSVEDGASIDGHFKKI